MTVFYSIYNEDGTRDYCFTQYLSNIIFPDLDLSYKSEEHTSELQSH